MPYDLFISYSQRDNANGRVTQLVERIKKDFAESAGRPLASFFDTTEIHGMEEWRQKILLGLRESHLLLACISPAYLESEYCQWELVEYLKYEFGHLHGFTGIAPIYFAHVPGWNDKDFDQRCAAWVAELRKRQNFDLRPWSAQGEEALRDATVGERMEKLIKQIADIITRGERAEKSLGNVDAPNPHFVGRTANFRQLREKFVKPGHIGVLTTVNGLGGLGKTGLAVQYAHSFANEYGGGRWQVRCAGKEDLRLALAELATPVGFQFTDDERKNLDLQFDRTRRELKQLSHAREPHRCLLLLDNIDNPKLLDPAQIARLNAGDWLHILATTQLGENELSASHKDRSFLAIDELLLDDALALIETYQPGNCFRSEGERAAAREIVRLLGCFTLAVESAAVYLGQFANDVTCAAFLTRLQKEGLKGLDTAATQSSEGVLHGEKRLGATLRPTLERLNESEKLALTFAAFLPADQIALPWLRALVGKEYPEMEHDAEPGYPDPWKNLLRRLFSLRLLQPTGVIDADRLPLMARVHRLVQQLMLLNIQPQARDDLQQAVTALAVNRVAAFERITRWEDARWELEPLTALAWLWDETKHPQTVSLLNEMSLHWQNLAEWSRVEPLMRRALVLNEITFGPAHPNMAISLNNLAGLLKTTNRLTEVEALYRRALDINEFAFGSEHPEVAKNLNNLAQLLKTTNRLPQAEQLMRRALAIDEKILGPDHPDVATYLNNLADLLQDTNRLDEAQPMYRRALTIIEKNFGPEHPAVAKVLNNLAQLLQDTKRLAEAESMNHRSLQINERSFGPDHPAVAVSLACQAHLMRATNRLAEAEPLMRRALAIWEKSLGTEHPDVAIELNNLALLLQNTKRLDEGEPLMRRALVIDEMSLGLEHPKVALDLNNLAHMLKETNRFGEAEPLMRRAVEILLKFTRDTGHPHPQLRTFINNYQIFLQGMGRAKEEILDQLRTMAPEFFPE